MSRTGARTGRGPRRLLITVIVIVALLAGLDFAARAVAEDVMATKIQQQGLTNKPDVSIGGFPFLTQVAGKDFQRVSISDTDQKAGSVTITSFSATATAIRLSSYSFSSGTIGALHGTALIGFGSLGNAISNQVGALGSVLGSSSLSLSSAGPDKVKASLNLLVFSGSATWRVTWRSGSRLTFRLVSTSGGVPADLLGPISDFTLTIPKLPLGLTIDTVRVSPAGLVGTISGSNVPFGS